MIHSKFKDLLPAQIKKDDPELARPDEDAIAEVSCSHFCLGTMKGDNFSLVSDSHFLRSDHFV